MPDNLGIGNLYSDGVNIYAGEPSSIYISKNGGSSWTQLGSDYSSDTSGGNEVKQILKLDGYVFIRVWESAVQDYKIYRIAN